MSSDNEDSQLSSPVQYDTDTFFLELASDAPPWGRGGGGAGMDMAG